MPFQILMAGRRFAVTETGSPCHPFGVQEDTKHGTACKSAARRPPGVRLPLERSPNPALGSKGLGSDPPVENLVVLIRSLPTRQACWTCSRDQCEGHRAYQRRLSRCVVRRAGDIPLPELRTMIRLRWISSGSKPRHGGRLGRCHIARSTSPSISPLLRSKTTRHRRFIRPASFLGLSFLLGRRGGMPLIQRAVANSRVIGSYLA